MDNLISDLEDKMQKTILSLNNEFNKIRTGRANPAYWMISKLIITVIQPQ